MNVIFYSNTSSKNRVIDIDSYKGDYKKLETKLEEIYDTDILFINVADSDDDDIISDMDDIIEYLS